MTILEFLRTASEDEIIDKMAYMNNQNNLSVALDTNFISPYALCVETDEYEDDCEYYDCDECFEGCILKEGVCPRNINLKEVQKNEIREWLNRSLEFERTEP